MSHRLKRIQDAEETALQHSNHVAEGFYRQNRANETQIFVQTYNAENKTFPDNILASIDQNEQDFREEIDDEEKSRMNKRYENLLRMKEVANQRKAELKGLNCRNRISNQHRTYLCEVLEEISNGNLKEYLSSLNPTEWRHWLVRAVCLADGRFESCNCSFSIS